MIIKISRIEIAMRDAKSILDLIKAKCPFFDGSKPFNYYADNINYYDVFEQDITDHQRYETYLTWFMNKFIIEQEIEQKEEIEETLFQYLRTKYSNVIKIQESIKYD